MKKAKIPSIILALLLSLTLVLPSLPLKVEAAPSIQIIDGARTAFVSSFGRLVYEGNAQQAYKTFNEAFNALGKEGGTIIFTGTLKIDSFNDIEGRAPITIIGTGTKAVSNCLDFSSIKTGAINFKGDITLCFLAIKVSENTYIYTNGHNFDTRDQFTVFYNENYGKSGDDKFTFPNPPSFAPGEFVNKNGSIYLYSAVCKNLVAGSANGKPITGNTNVAIDSGKIDLAVSGNIGSGAVNGNTKLTIGDVKVESLVAGSSGGTINGNVTTIINGGVINNTVVGATNGATINGSVVVALNGGEFTGPVTLGDGTVTGSKIVIISETSTASLASGISDYTIRISGGYCEPIFEGASVKGFLLTDSYGIPVNTAVINGAQVSSENGIYSLASGESSVAITTTLSLGINKNAKYVAGYTDGSFLPQNNLTRAEAITLLVRLITDDSNVKGKVRTDYADVAEGAWYEGYIGLFQKLGFLKTIECNHGILIKPDQTITRAEFAELLYRMSTLGTKSAAAKLKPFSDVKTTHTYAPAITWSVSNNIVSGYDDGTFRPENNITRAEVVTMVNRFLGRVPTEVQDGIFFSDINAHWAKEQILAASGDENTAWVSAPASNEYKITGNSAEDYIKALYNQKDELSADAIRRGVDAIAEQMKSDVLNSANTLDIYGDKLVGTIYYVSEKNGDDNNDGLSPETAWKTLAALSKIRLAKKGSAVLFERGGIYRGTVGVAAGMTYGSYGTGPKPLIMQSAKNYADPDLWVETEWPNVFLCTDKLSNVGVIGFDHDLFDYSQTAYDEQYGLIMNKGYGGVVGPESLKKDLQFYSDLPNNATRTPGNLYLYSKNGNPGSRFKSIEIGENIAIFSGAAHNVTIDNLAVKFTGGHGMGGAGGAVNRVVTNCVWSWIGGSVLSTDGKNKVVNYGNAIEIYGGCDGFDVVNNWMYQIYDTGVTHQRSSSTGNCIQKNINYLNNLIEYVFWGIEFYNSPPTADQLNGKPDTWTRMTENVLSAYNVLRKGGYGWGSVVRYRTCNLYCGSTLSDNQNCRAEYNIFDRGTGNIIHLPANSTEALDKNFYIQHLNRSLGNLKGTNFTADYNANKYIENQLGDKNAVVIIIDPEIEPIEIFKPEGLA